MGTITGIITMATRTATIISWLTVTATGTSIIITTNSGLRWRQLNPSI
jgi:hypothetical protein